MAMRLYETEHEDFRKSVRTFVEREVEPFHLGWEAEGKVDRQVWLAAGEAGILGMDVPAEYGGGGEPDFRFQAVVLEELVRAGASGPGFGLHNAVVAPYLVELGTHEQKSRWLPGFCSGELITAIAMTEPDAGSDLAGIRTTARRDGDDFVVNGAKTFITNGILADAVIVVAKTAPDKGMYGVSLFVVERGMPGFGRGRRLSKIGLKAQDTAELVFDDVRVPAGNLLGELDQGFEYLLSRLPRERLAIAVGSVTATEAMIELTVAHCRQRMAFGRSIGSFQNTRFVLADLATRAEVTRSFVNDCVVAYNEGRLSAKHAAMAKWWASELQNECAAKCLQLHGGYGFMTEYPIAKHFLDARVQTIYGGTTEVMKDLVALSLGLD
jgi:alkylation response protein AidB-like acyl-CoA dehydrogenase